jgi:lipopolysaccharide export system protein LptA
MKGNGDTATFYAQEEKLVLDGMPKLSEPGRADIHGRMLTLFLTDGRILIDGQADGRATTTLEMKGSTVSSTPSKSEKPTDKNVPDASTKNGEPDKEL